MSSPSFGLQRAIEEVGLVVRLVKRGECDDIIEASTNKRRSTFRFLLGVLGAAYQAAVWRAAALIF